MIIAEKGKIVVMGVTNLMNTKIKTNVHMIVSKHLLRVLTYLQSREKGFNNSCYININRDKYLIFTQGELQLLLVQVALL